MKKYKTVEVSEKILEDLIRQGPDLIEDGLVYIDHQKMTDRGPLDVLFVDSGKSLVIAELKIVEDDSMLFQGIDYYDYISKNIEALARNYKKNYDIDTTQPARLFLISPNFSMELLNRCKWIDIPISLFTFKCIQLEGDKDIIPVFSEVTIPSAPEVVTINYNLEDKINYITNPITKNLVTTLLDEIKRWDEKRVLIEPLKYDISLKVDGNVFAYICPRRKHFMVYTYDDQDKWTGFPINSEEDLKDIKVLIKENFEYFLEGKK